MDSINWVRLAAIGALFLGSIYVLLPTVLQADLDERLATAASGIEAPGGGRGADLGVTFDVVSGDAVTSAEALDARLDAAGVDARVEDDAGRVEVLLAPGADRDDVVRLAEVRGARSLYAPASIVAAPAAPGDPTTLPPALATALGSSAARWASHVEALAGAAVPADATALEVTLAGVSRSEAGLAAQPVELAGAPFAAVAVDDTVVGVVLPDGAIHLIGTATTGDAPALLVSGPLPGRLSHLPADEVSSAAEDEIVEAAESSVPPWLLGLLPNTRMNLGLDLQGGIDLTLQVELLDAVLGQVTRDITYLKDEAAKEGLIVDSVRRSHSEPVIQITTDAQLSEVQDFLRQRLNDYVYSESDGTMHAFEMSDQRQKEVQDQSVEQVLETLRKRVDATGVKEPSIVKKGGGRINVQLPGMVDVQAAVDAIGTTAVLQFRMVDEEFDDALLDQIVQDAERSMPADQFADDELLNLWLWENNRLDDDRIILWTYEPGPDGAEEQRYLPMPLKNQIVLTGNDVNDAGVSWDQNQQAYVSLEFKPRGGQIFCDVTTKNVQKRFAIVLDDQITSAPSIRERICGGAARIDMSSSEDPLKEAQTLALVLRTGALDAPVVVASVRQVGATLGADSIRQGSAAAIVGGMVVLVFMGLWYRTAGLLADIALVINVLLVLGALALFGATLTLPGIAGIALTIGMAVDANIIIYERIREELRLGVPPRKAVDVGFDKAIVAVLDANITTAIAGIVLFSYGTGPIKGFAVTLLIGIATTLVTALFVTRTLMDIVTRSSAARLKI